MPPDRRYAVALRYQEDDDDAPRVLAKGQGEVADRIVALAKAHQVPLHQDHDLVELLVVLDLGAVVPPALYHALAEVLAHLYRANHRMEAIERVARADGAARPP